MKTFGNLDISATLADVIAFCQDVTRKRKDDIGEVDNFANIFISGRKVAKVPTASTDTIDSRVGDFNYDAAYLYVCVDVAGSAAWRRVALGSW